MYLQECMNFIHSLNCSLPYCYTVCYITILKKNQYIECNFYTGREGSGLALIVIVGSCTC